MLFDELELFPSDVGKTFIANAFTDPDFNTIRAAITNGVPNDIGFGLFFPESKGGGGNSTNWDERNLFQLPTNDFSGKTVGSIRLTFDYLTIESPGSNPNRDGKWTDMAAAYTITVDTVVPEPATAGSLAILAAMTMPRRRR